MFLRKKHRELTRHVGGEPTPTQLALIRRIARLEWYVNRLDQDAETNDGMLSEYASRIYLAYVNSVGRLSRQLGLQGAVGGREPTIADLLVEAAARPSATPAASTTELKRPHGAPAREQRP